MKLIESDGAQSGLFDLVDGTAAIQAPPISTAGLARTSGSNAQRDRPGARLPNPVAIGFNPVRQHRPF
jgi:hypothetical protein